MMTSDDLRREFLHFFEGKGHKVVPSSSLVPRGDPTLLLTSAGMVQFKPYFTGERVPPSPRLASCQKCFRTTDIDSVGNLKHLTFFEMLGNFSIGDYFKKETIAWAWEFVTEVLRIPPDHLWVTYYKPALSGAEGEGEQEDLEAKGYWLEATKGRLPQSRIVPLGAKYNWWGPAGEEGPCGPCSEIHYSYDPEHTTIDDLTGDSPREVEIWNLVFTQFYHHRDGRRTPLPAPNIDTGMGLERTIAILQGKASFYETDLFTPLMERIQELCRSSYGADGAKDRAMRVVAEHGRAAAFLIADGVLPSNEGRGYVLRRVLRRAALFGRKLGLEGPFLGEMAQAVIGGMGHVYPELVRHRDFILKAIALEEEGFGQALTRGSEMVGGYIAGLKTVSEKDIEEVRKAVAPALEAQVPGKVELPQQVPSVLSTLGEHVASAREKMEFGTYDNYKGSYELACSEIIRALCQLQEAAEPWAHSVPGPGGRMSWSDEADSQRVKREFAEFVRVVRTIPGARVFELWDTYGFPVELTAEMAREHGLAVDIPGFQAEMAAQKERARASHKFGGGMVSQEVYEALGLRETPFLGYEGTEHRTVVVGLLHQGEWLDRAMEGQEVEVALAETPFYGEAGGQVGDTGEIRGPGGRFLVEDAVRPLGDLIVHRGRVEEGSLSLDEVVEAVVDRERRLDIARNHTATHLLQAALRLVLGEHVRQTGSLVAPDRLRFDFTHLVALSPEERAQVEQKVNEFIRGDLPLSVGYLPYREAVERGAIALFDEKYGEQVRLVEIRGPQGRVSAELCGGTHLARTGEIGLFSIQSEASIGGGVRRIEALTGRGAEAWFYGLRDALEEMASALHTSPAEVKARVASLLSELEAERRRAAALERDLALQEAKKLLDQKQEVAGIPVVSGQISASSMEALRQAGDWLRDKLGSGVVVLGAIYDDRPNFLAMATPDLVARGLHAGELVKMVAQVAGGSGGGRPHLGQAGGRDKAKLAQALKQVPGLVRGLLPSGEGG